MPDAYSEPDVNNESLKVEMNLMYSMIQVMFTLFMCCGLLPCVVGKYWQKVRDLSRHVRRYIERVLLIIPYVKDLIGAKSKQKLLFVPDADNKPEDKHEISEAAIFRFLLNEETLKELDVADGAEISEMLDVLKDLDNESKIVEFETHQSSMGSATDFKKAFHVFIVFKTKSKNEGVYWWSLEKNAKYIVLQRSRNRENVKDKYDKEPRKKVKLIKEGLNGKGTLKDLFEILWAHQMISENYHILNSNCQSFVTCISQQITEIGYEYKGYFNYSPPERGLKKKMLDLINILTGRNSCDCHPLFHLLSLGNTDLVDEMIASGKYNINASYNGLIPLHHAIMLSKTKMVQHLLKDPLNADPTTRNATGKSALHHAAFSTMKAEIFDLLLAHEKVNVNDVDKNGQTALHLAASVSNVVAAHKLLEKGANLNIVDKDDLTPLHVAAQERDGNPIIDLLLEAQKVKGMGDVNNPNNQGRTALHYAAFKSNEITAEYLIQKGADVNRRENDGQTPLHAAATFAKNMNIIDVLLRNITEEDLSRYRNDKRLFLFARDNKHGLEEEIIDRFLKKGIQPPSTETDDCITAESDEATDVSRHFEEEGVDPLNDLTGVDGIQFLKAGVKNSHEFDDILKEKEFDIKEFFKKHMRDHNNRKPSELENILSDDTVPIENTLDKAFFATAISGLMNVESVRLLLKNEASDISARGRNGMNFLHMVAADTKTTDVIDVVLETGYFDINGTDNKGDTPLHYAIMDSNVTTARYLLEKGADPTIRNNRGCSPFHLSTIFLTDTNVLGLMLEKETKIDIDERAKFGLTALHMAIMESNVNVTRFLLSIGANPNLAEKDGRTPLHLVAMYAKDTDIVELLLNHPDVHVNLMDHYGYNNALHYARDNKHGLAEEIANLLKEKTVLLKAEGNKHEPENIAALVDSHMKTIRLLIEDGQDIRAMTWGENGANALHLAAADEETTDLIDAILETGQCNINGVDSDGRTPLHYAIKRPVTINVRRLIQMGADPGIADKNGVTLLHLAVIYAETMDLIELLLNTEAVDVTDCDDNGLTARDYARYNKHGLGDTIVDRLTKHLSAFRMKVLFCLCWILCCVFLLAVYIVEA